MSIIRAKRDRNYSVISNSVYMDNRLSFQAMGLLSYILSKPDNWKVNVEHLVGVTKGTQKRTGRDGVYAILKELKNLGFVTMTKRSSGESDYLISDIPKKPDTDNPDKGKTEQENPDTDKPDQANTEQAEPNPSNPDQDNPDLAEPTLISTEYKQVLRSNKKNNKKNPEPTPEPVPEPVPDPETEYPYSEEIKIVIDHLNQKVGGKFQKRGQSARFISGRLNDGNSVQDLIDVIDCKIIEWGQNAKMCQFLRPSTLFSAEKFAGYLLQANSINLGVAVDRDSEWIPDDESTDWAKDLGI